MDYREVLASEIYCHHCGTQMPVESFGLRPGDPRPKGVEFLCKSCGHKFHEQLALHLGETPTADISAQGWKKAE